MSSLEKLKYNWSSSGILLQLILINVILFIPLNISASFGGNLVSYFALRLTFSEFIAKPWTFLTCMFSHESLGHIFSNMLLLFMMGRIFLVVTGFTHWTKITFLYLFGGISGNILLLMSKFLFPGMLAANYALGASDGVLAIALAVGIFCPDYIVHLILFGEVRLKWIVAVIFILSTLIDLQVNTGGKISHLGGAAFGIIYGWQLKNRNDLSDWFTALFTSGFKRSKLKVVHKKNKYSSYNSYTDNDEQLLNALLDKINKSGYESLKKEEKETLHRLSKKK